MTKLKYGETTLPVGDNVTEEDGKASLARIYPELSNATSEVTYEDGEKVIEFKVQSGTKGAGRIIARYNGGDLTLPEGTTAEDAKKSLSVVYPELANASIPEGELIDGDIIYDFKVQSGTKGIIA